MIGKSGVRPLHLRWCFKKLHGTGNGIHTEGNEINNTISLETMLCDPILESGFSGIVVDAVNGDLLAGEQINVYFDDNG